MENLNYRELARKYQNTWGSILIKDTKEIIPVYFSKMRQQNDESYRADLTYFKLKGLSYSERLLGSNEASSMSLNFNDFDILPTPDAQVFDSNRMSVVFNRNPARQWQKGLNSSNTFLDIPTANILHRLPESPDYRSRSMCEFRWDTSSFINLFDSFTAGSFTKAIEDIINYKLFSRCVDSKYFVSIFPSLEVPYVLFRLDVPVAYYSEKRDTFILLNQVYTQELQDFIRVNNLNSKIEV